MKTLDGVVMDCWSHPKGGWSAAVHFDNEVPVGMRLQPSPTAQPAPALTPQADSQPAPNDEAILSAARNWGDVQQYNRTDGKGTEHRIVFSMPRRAAHFARELLAARAPADSVTAPAAGAVAGPVEKQVQRIGKGLLRSEQMHAAKPDRIASALRAMSESMHTDYKQEIGSNNCMQCCVAYMLGMPISHVPHFAQSNDPVACWDGFQSFIAKQGYTAVMLPGDQRPESHYLASGKSARGTSHMVVMHDGKLLHDPHPTNAGLVDVQCIWLLAKSAAAPTPAAQGDADRDREDLMHCFWVAMSACETAADNDNDPVLRIQVEGFYRLWNRLNAQELQPAWVRRAALAQKEGA